MKNIKQLPSGRWRVQIRQKHLDIDEVFDTLEEAVACRDAAMRKKAEYEGPLTLRQVWEMYSASPDFLEKALNTRKTETTRMTSVLAALGAYTLEELADVTSTIRRHFKARQLVVSPRTKKVMSKSSVRLEMAALAAVVNYAVEEELIDKSFMTGYKRPGQVFRKRRVPAKEQGKLAMFARNADPEVGKAARFLLLIRHLGCRPGELQCLRKEHVLLDENEVVFLDTKNGTDRRVHTIPDARQLLALQLELSPDETELLFPTWSKYKKAWVPFNYAEGVRKLRKLGVVGTDYHAHAGRREFVSRAIESNMPMLTIKKQTGHKSTQALEIYDESLSTAPEIRAELDRHASQVQLEALRSLVQSAGLTPEQRDRFAQLLGEAPRDPFEAKKQRLASKNSA